MLSHCFIPRILQGSQYPGHSYIFLNDSIKSIYKSGEMSTLHNSYGNISCVRKKPQLCCTGPRCQSNLAISLENILHPALQTPPIVSRHDNKQNRGHHMSSQSSCKSKSTTEILTLVLYQFLTH